MSAKKDCGNHKREKLFRRLFAVFLALIILILIAILVIWLVLRPTKPRFVLQDAALSQFNLTSGNMLSTAVQISLVARNPNDRIGVYYDRLAAYAVYRNQQVTVAAALFPTYQGRHEITTWSPLLAGSAVPVSPLIGLALAEDEATGYYVFNVKADGRVRWKVGDWTSGRYRIHVNCAAYLKVDSGGGGGGRLAQPVGCNVDV